MIGSYCYTCNLTRNMTGVLREDCLTCANRWTTATSGKTGTCVWCGTNKYNPDGTATSSDTCTDCPEDKSTLTEAKYCYACGGSWENGQCS